MFIVTVGKQLEKQDILVTRIPNGQFQACNKNIYLSTNYINLII